MILNVTAKLFISKSYHSKFGTSSAQNFNILILLERSPWLKRITKHIL